MANTLTNLTPTLYAALDVVSRELSGMIVSVSRDSGMERAAKDQTIRSFVAPASTASDISPGQLPADNGDQTIGSKSITISKSRYVPIRWNGEEQYGMNTGPGYNPILQDQIAQAMRTLVNEIELDLCGLYQKASRAVAPAGTTLFDSTGGLKDVANARRILADNGAPMNDVSLVLNTKAGAALRGLNQYAGANTAGNDNILRQGVLLDLYGVQIRESAQIYTHVNGTYDSLAVNDAVEPIGETSISVGTEGSGGVLPGDVISVESSVGGDLYVVSTANANVDAGNIDINAPGLREATPGSVKKILLNAALDRNMMFSRNAIHLVTRAPARPSEGDNAADYMIVQDPRSGLAFEIAMYKEYRQVKYEVSIAWGYEMIKSEHCALLID